MNISETHSTLILWNTHPHHTNQCILLWLASSSHQYCDIASVIRLQFVFKFLKTNIAYVVIACATDLSKVSLPPDETIFSLHPAILWINLSTKYWKQTLLSNLALAGKPRYFSERASVIISKIVQTWAFVDIRARTEKDTRFLNTRESNKIAHELASLAKSVALLFGWMNPRYLFACSWRNFDHQWIKGEFWCEKKYGGWLGGNSFTG